MTIFDLTIAADRFNQLPLILTVDADAAQRARLSATAGLEDCTALTAAATLRPAAKAAGAAPIELEIHLRADIVQACSVTLDPVPETIDETYVFEVHTRPPRTPVPAIPDDPHDLADAPDIVDISDTQRLDLGALIEEVFYLSINPYPRSTALPEGDEPMIVFSDDPVPLADHADPEPAAPTGTRRPFAGLADMLREKSVKSG